MRKLDVNKPVVTRAGLEAEIIASDMISVYPIAAKITLKDGSQTVETYTEYGSLFKAITNELDLVNVPEEVYGYVNFVDVNGDMIGSSVYETRDLADKCATRYRISCQKVKLVRGQFDD